jgi:hypothetical protein
MALLLRLCPMVPYTNIIPSFKLEPENDREFPMEPENDRESPFVGAGKRPRISRGAGKRPRNLHIRLGFWIDAVSVCWSWGVFLGALFILWSASGVCGDFCVYLRELCGKFGLGLWVLWEMFGLGLWVLWAFLCWSCGFILWVSGVFVVWGLSTLGVPLGTLRWRDAR